jgi:hypothetical protein
MTGARSSLALLLALGLLPAAAAQQPAQLPAQEALPPGPPEKIRQLIVYGSDPCPPSTGEEIVVCARRPETERYRIPENLREPEPDPESESWAARAESLEYVGRSGIDSCSPVGPGGMTGCLTELIRRAREERRQAATVPPR